MDLLYIATSLAVSSLFMW